MLLSILMSMGAVGTTLSGGSGGLVQQIDGASTYDSTVGIRFNTDGTVQTGKSLDGAAVSWSAAGNWIDPTSEADTSYSVRCTNISITSGADDWSNPEAAEDAWVQLGSITRSWTNNETTVGTHSFTCDFEVRKTAGAPPATGSSSYTFSISNTV